MPPLIYRNVRVTIVSGTRVRVPEPEEAAVIRPLLEELFRLDGHIRDGGRYIPGIGHVRWKQAGDASACAPPRETARYIVLNVVADNIFEEILWKGTFSDPGPASTTFEDIVANNRRQFGGTGEVYVIDRMDGRVLQSTELGGAYSPRASRWLRYAEDELRTGRSSAP